MEHTENFYFQTKDLSVGYHGVPLIKNIDIQIRRGEILTLIGPNGAGKTTILKSIIRQLSPLAGVVSLEGQDMADMDGRKLSEKMAVLLTDRVHPELMSCEDVVATGRYPYTGTLGILNEKDRLAVREAMEMVDILPLAERDFGKTSDGQKQRIMLARALCQEPDVIVLDEPTSYLDVRYKLEFLSIIRKMTREKNLSVIMSLHELDLAQRISDKIACIKGDSLERFGTPEEIFTPGYISRLFDVAIGNFDEDSGTLELGKPEGEPEVFVIAGGGSGLPVFRRLQRNGTPFAAGILFENDRDYVCARALASTVVSAEAFGEISASQIDEAKAIIRKCQRVICCRDSFGIWDRDNKKLLDYAEEMDFQVDFFPNGR